MGYPKHKPTHYNVAEAKAQFSTLVRKALQGEEVVIARANKPLVKLVPVAVPARTPGSARGRVTVAADFDAPLDDFSDYR
ncbi:MAG TPA: type II toxin-antitoxin system prevent-host-death family antitoxin [Vicinamibacterales bacterium]|nr:type II toxin-antitoxin system prevent-host-death family antitoxin [Vicinamibacterales bacterium]